MSLFSGVRFIDFQKLRKDPEAVLRRVLIFLGIDEPEKLDLDKDRNATKLRNWHALKQNRQLQFDHTRPTLLSVLRQQFMLFSLLREEKPVLGQELTKLLDDAFLDLRNTDQAVWV